jgi:Protein of unknown function (DUF3179)
VWERNVDGRTLNFHLSGINNQNFIMRDEETGSWWQQVSGECIAGPLKGKQLQLVAHDELPFALWKREQPAGRVLMPDERVAAQYAPVDWEDRYATLRVVTPANPDDALKPRDLVIGITVNGAATAYPMSRLEKQAPVTDTLGGTPLVVMLDASKKSVRAFECTVDGRALSFSVKQGTSQITDAETGSAWEFTGRAVSGPLAGRRLRPVSVLKDYWFDWKIYHPDTAVFGSDR